ncbi:MAG: GntR family transcriptional regulator, partial [Firmicutes bacterium]|nr:GntR family transcriptional regulator [Bacillota bacterium]
MNISERYARETARDYALRMLKRNIASMDLEPGAMLSENEISAAMGLSRTPVR